MLCQFILKSLTIKQNDLHWKLLVKFLRNGYKKKYYFKECYWRETAVFLTPLLEENSELHKLTVNTRSSLCVSELTEIRDCFQTTGQLIVNCNKRSSLPVYKPCDCLGVNNAGVSKRNRQQANWPAVNIVLPAFHEHIKVIFFFDEVKSKQICPPVK